MHRRYGRSGEEVQHVRVVKLGTLSPTRKHLASWQDGSDLAILPSIQLKIPDWEMVHEYIDTRFLCTSIAFVVNLSYTSTLPSEYSQIPCTTALLSEPQTTSHLITLVQ